MNIFSTLFSNNQNESQNFFKHIAESEIPKFGLSNINRYDMLKVLGEGSFGKVFRAENIETKEIMAIKEYKTLETKDQINRHTLREIKLLQNCQHPNIVFLNDICYKHKYTENGFSSTFYLVFEFCNQTLRQRISNKALEMYLSEKRSIMKQLLDGVLYIHNKQIIHRDLKPSNILINKYGTIKIADFGLSRPEKCTGLGKRPIYSPDVGTKTYQAPEILVNHPTYTNAIDIWSLGCIFIELWTKRPVFRGKCTMEQIKQIAYLCGDLIHCNYVTSIKKKITNSRQRIQTASRLKSYLSKRVTYPLAETLIYPMLSVNYRTRPCAYTLLANLFFK